MRSCDIHRKFGVTKRRAPEHLLNVPGHVGIGAAGEDLEEFRDVVGGGLWQADLHQIVAKRIIGDRNIGHVLAERLAQFCRDIEERRGLRSSEVEIARLRIFVTRTCDGYGRNEIVDLGERFAAWHKLEIGGVDSLHRSDEAGVVVPRRRPERAAKVAEIRIFPFP